MGNWKLYGPGDNCTLGVLFNRQWKSYRGRVPAFSQRRLLRFMQIALLI